MKKFSIILIFFLSILQAKSLVVDVNVPEILDSRISSFIIDKSNPNVVNVKVEVHNTGSLPFNSRVRLDIFGLKGLNRTVWSEEKLINPSEKKVFNLFFYSNESDYFRVKSRIYYSNEIMDYKDVTFELEKTKQETSDIFFIKKMRISKDHLKFDIKSEENGNYVISFFGYPKSWIVEQEVISLKAGKWSPVKVNFKPVGDLNKKLGLEIFSLDGNFYKLIEFKPKRESKIEEIYGNLLDLLRR